MSLARTSGSGLLDRNESDNGSFPFNTSEWTAPSGWSKFLISGRLVIQSSGNHAPSWITRDISNQSEMMVYVRNDHDNALQMGLGVLVSNNTAGSQDGIEGACACSFSGGRFLTYWTSGSVTAIDSTGSGINLSSPHQLSLWADNNDAALYDHANAAIESGTYPSAKTGKPGIFCDFGTTGQQFNVEKFFVFTGRYLVVNGLSSGSGQKAKIRKSDGTVLAQATESSGTATIDCITITEWWNVDNLQITTSGDSEIEEEVDPGNIWAGETWLFTAPTVEGAHISSTATLYAPTVKQSVTTAFIASTAVLFGVTLPGPATPTISAEATGPRSTGVEGSTYSHPLDVPIAAVEWRIATNAGMSTGLETFQVDFADPSDAPDPLVYGWADREPSTTYWHDVRYQDANGIWSGRSAAVSATTDAEDAGPTPVIVSAAPGTVDVTLLMSIAADPDGRTVVATDWQVDVSAGDFSSPVNEALEVLVTPPLSGAGSKSQNLPGLTQATSYKGRGRVRWSDGAVSAWSAPKSFTTLTAPANRPSQPTLEVDQITQTTFRLTMTSTYSDPTGSPHNRTRWYVTNYPGGPTFGLAYRFYDVTTGTFKTQVTVTGATQNTKYNATMFVRALDGDWSDAAPWVEFFTLAAPLNGGLLQIQTPRQGAIVRGAAVPVSWTPASDTGSTFEIDRATSLAGPWTSVATGLTSSPYSWNTGSLNGVFWLRLRALEGDEVTEYEYRLVYVDNANLQAGATLLFGYNADNPAGDGATLGDWDPAWEESGIGWSIVGGPTQAIVRFTSPAFSLKESALRFLPAFEPRQVDILGEVLAGSTGGSFPWNRFPEQAWCGIGCFAAGGVTGIGPENGVVATIYAVPIQANGDCEIAGSGDGFLSLAVYDNGERIQTADVSIGRVHVVNQFFGCTKVPRYGMRLRLTTIADLPGARRRLRVQVSVTGRGIDIPDDGWHLQTTVETALDCGCAAFTARNANTTNNPYRSFTALTVIPYEYGECDAPPGFEEPVQLERCEPPVQDLTIFDIDNVTPLPGLGEVDEYGEIVESSFSTDPNHPRPYLKRITAGPEHEVDPISMGSSIGTIQAEIVDKRTEPCDQATGIVTVNAASGFGDSNYIGHRAVAREKINGIWYLIQDGPIGHNVLLRTRVTYQMTIASMREREREVPAFDNQYLTMSGYPYGPVEGYGYLGTSLSTDYFMLNPAGVATGTYNQGASAGDRIFGEIEVDDPTEFAARRELSVIGTADTDYPDSFAAARFYKTAVLRWRYPGDDNTEWRYIFDMPATGMENMIELVDAPPLFERFFGWPDMAVLSVKLNVYSADAATLKPTDGATVEFQVLPNTAPSEAFPFYWDGSFGTLLRNLYDGAFSPESPLVRYDEECMAAFEEAAPNARLRKWEAVDDLREWVEKNIYVATGWLPSISDDGSICPINGAKPEGDEPLVTVDNAECIAADYSHDGSRAAPIVTFRFQREWTVQVAEDPDQYDVVAKPVEVTSISPRAGALLRSKALIIAPETVRSLGGPLYEANPELSSEAALQLALSRAQSITDLFAFGPQIVTLRVRDTANTRQLRVGTWFILDVPWIPNLATALRGGPQLALVTRRKKDPGLAWDMTVILGGGALSGLDVPTISTPTQGTDGVCVYVEGDYEDRIYVEWGIGDTEPTSWTVAGYVDGAGTICIPPAATDVTMWFRAWATRYGYRDSARSAAVSITIGEDPSLSFLAVFLAFDGTPTVQWTANAVTLGVLIEWSVETPPAEPSYANDEEADATLGELVLATTVSPGDRISVKVTPYSGFSMGSVTGTPGTTQFTYADME